MNLRRRIDRLANVFVCPTCRRAVLDAPSAAVSDARAERLMAYEQAELEALFAGVERLTCSGCHRETGNLDLSGLSDEQLERAES